MMFTELEDPFSPHDSPYRNTSQLLLPPHLSRKTDRLEGREGKETGRERGEVSIPRTSMATRGDGDNSEIRFLPFVKLAPSLDGERRQTHVTSTVGGGGGDT